MTGITPWKTPNHRPMMTMVLTVTFLTANPLQMDTAKASIAKPMPVNRNVRNNVIVPSPSFMIAKEKPKYGWISNTRVRTD